MTMPLDSVTPHAPAHVTMRVYARLNDFVPPSSRGRRFEHPLRGPTSLKDAIEAAGVPHPEVDLVLVNGTGRPFAHRLRPGDDVSVYPAFTSLDVSSLGRVGAEPPVPGSFLLDVHLGRLASLLRLAGLDAEVGREDAAIAERAARERRIVLTRDVDLLKRGLVVHGHWVRETQPESQFREIVERYDMFTQLDPFTRCSICNVPLVTADPAAVLDRVPARTRERFSEFRRCPRCGRVYWEGTHHDRLVRLFGRVVEPPDGPR